jgi:aspartyl-tRNA(Asn)/glutamyl-tRNA(Gln) amidotransferase subunit C
MSVDHATVKKIARLARISVEEGAIPELQTELNSILGFIEQLKEVDVTGIEPMTSVVKMRMKQREDIVNDGEDSARVLANAPAREDDFFVVPKVVE